MHPQIKNSFGGNDGIAEFREVWKPETADSGIWDTLGTVLALGGSFQDENAFVAPYVFSRWPGQFDSFEHVAVIGSDVRVRSQANTNAATLTTVSFAILPTARQVTELAGWTAVRLDTAARWLHRVGICAQPDRLSRDLSLRKSAVADGDAGCWRLNVPECSDDRAL